VTRLGSVEDANASVPDSITLPCVTIHELHALEDMVADPTVRAKLVNKQLCCLCTVSTV